MSAQVLELSLALLAMAFSLSWIAALVSAAGFGDYTWKRAGHDKALWTAAMCFSGGLVGIVYLVAIRPRLLRVEGGRRTSAAC